MPTVPISHRLAAVFIAACCLAVLSIAAWLTPSPAGFGTHEQLRLRSGVGLQTCTWLALTGKPCMTCGMTTSFAHAANGDLIASFKAQPMGMILAVVTSMMFWICGHIAAYGSNLGSAVAGLMGRRTLWTMLGLLIAAWVYKVLTWG